MKNFGDERQSAWCVHCGSSTKGSRDHIPSKSFLDKPYPPNLPTLDICDSCNKSFALDEEYTACLIECVVCGTTESSGIEREKIRKSFRSNPKLKERIARSKSKAPSEDDMVATAWTPEWHRISSVFLKNARGHALYELNEPVPRDNPTHSLVCPLHLLDEQQRLSFESPPEVHVLPEVGSRAMQRLVIGEDISHSWIVIQPNRYRYMTIVGFSIMVRMVIREYLAVEYIWEP